MSLGEYGVILQKTITVSVGKLQSCSEHQTENKEKSHFFLFKQNECFQSQFLGKCFLALAGIFFFRVYNWKKNKRKQRQNERKDSRNDERNFYALSETPLFGENIGYPHGGYKTDSSPYPNGRKIGGWVLSFIFQYTESNGIVQSDSGHVKTHGYQQQPEKRYGSVNKRKETHGNAKQQV